MSSRQVCSDVFATFDTSLIVNDVSAVSTCVGDFVGGRVMRHDDCGAGLKQLCGECNSLRMVARRVSDDASIQRFTRQRTDGAACATEFKAAGDLQGFRF